MPRIPIIRPPEDSVSRETGDGSDMLPPEEAAGLRTLEARTARIDRELAVSQSWLAGLTRLAAAEDAPEGPSPGFMRNFLEETDRERALILKPLPRHRQAPLEQDLMALRQGLWAMKKGSFLSASRARLTSTCCSGCVASSSLKSRMSWGVKPR